MLELFSREFYQSKKNKELQLGGTVCIETKSKNGKRLMRRVRVANKAEHLKPYLQRVCHVLNCCPQLLSFTRYPMGYCSASCMIRGTPHLTYSCSHAAASLQSRRMSEHALESRPPSSIGELRKPGFSTVERPRVRN